MLTIKDIQKEVPVASRTIRSWVQVGLLPRPKKTGLGRGKGTKAVYPESALERAKTIYSIRNASKTKNLVKHVGTHGSIIVIKPDESGLLTLTYKPKSFQENS